MSQNSFVLSLHFLLELGALAAVGYWGWTTHDGVPRWAWSIGLPLALAVAWAVFRAVGDGPEPIVTIPGIARLLLELAILGGAVVLLWRAGQPSLAGILGALVVFDFTLQYDRVGRLLGL